MGVWALVVVVVWVVFVRCLVLWMGVDLLCV